MITKISTIGMLRFSGVLHWDESYDDEMKVTVVATGLTEIKTRFPRPDRKPERKITAKRWDFDTEFDDIFKIFNK